MITLILLIISFTIFVNTGSRTLTCNELFYKHLWINKTYNFSICLPFDMDPLNPFTWRADYSYYDQDFIWDYSNERISLLLNTSNSLWKYDKKSKFWNKEIIEHYVINNDGKQEFSTFIYELKIWKDRYYRFSFDKKTDEMKTIINSIKSLTEK